MAYKFQLGQAVLSGSVIAEGAVNAAGLDGGAAGLANAGAISGATTVTASGLGDFGSLTIDNASTLGAGTDADMLTFTQGDKITVASDLNFVISAGKLEIGDGNAVTATAAELNYCDITAAGTSEASKAMVTDANGDILMPDSDKFELGASSDMQLYHDGTNSYIANKTGALKVATETSGIAITIGHSTSEVTVADNLTVAGNLTVTGTTITDTVEVISTSSGVLFEGGTDDGHEATLKSSVAGADVTYTLPNLTGHVPLLADAATAGSAAVTAAEMALLDGGTACGTDAVSDGDGIFTNDGGVMKHTTVQTFQTYFDANSVGGTSIVTVGALNAGSISSGFGNIDNGTSNITTGGKIVLDVDGTAIGAAGALTMGAGNDAAVYFDGTNLVLDTAASAKVVMEVNGTQTAEFDADGLNLVSGDAFYINDASVLNATTLGSAVVASSLTSVGTIATGVWEATDVAVAHGGTGASTAAGALANLGLTAVAAEINLLDAGAGSTATLADGDGFIMFDASDSNNAEKVLMSDIGDYVATKNQIPAAVIDNSGSLAQGFNYFAALGSYEICTLPRPATTGSIVHVKAPSNCDGTRYIKIKRAGSGTIDGANFVILEGPDAAISLCYVGGSGDGMWKIF